MKILKRDFDAAIKLPWSTDTCLIAQADRRVHGKTDIDSLWAIAYASPVARRAMDIFDKVLSENGNKIVGKLPPRLRALRASLPITVEGVV